MSLFHSRAICEDELLVPPPMPQRTRLRPKIFGRSAHAQILYLLAQNIISTIQGGITCGAIDEPRKSPKAIDERVIINFRDKNVVIAHFRDKNGGFLFYR